MEITDNLKASTENNFISCGLFLDFSKAFDTINYQILPDKLCKYGARGRPHDWFVSYLQDRNQFAQIGDVLLESQVYWRWLVVQHKDLLYSPYYF